MGLKNVPGSDALNCAFVSATGDVSQGGMQTRSRCDGAGPIAVHWGGPFARVLVWPVDGIPKLPGVIHSWGQG